jgi:hypothetical protein
MEAFMNAPSGPQTPAELKAKIEAHVRERYVETGDNGWICKKCGSEVQATESYVSVHDALWQDCAGRGQVIHPALPYCPRCEGRPTKVSTCVHIIGEDELRVFGSAA